MYAQRLCLDAASAVVAFDSGRAISGRAISGRAISGRAISGRAISGRAISDCWRELYAAGLRYARHLLQQIHNRVDIARDIVQDALEVLLRQREAILCEEAFRAKYFRTIQNMCRNTMRHGKRWNCQPLDENAPEQYEYKQPMTAHVVLALEVGETVAQLPMEERRALLLHTIAGLTVQQLCIVDGCSLDTMKKRLDRARTRMIQALRNEEAVLTIAAFGGDLYAETAQFLDEAIAILPEIRQQTERRGRKPKN
jgi:RNA polymerase sigma-70 factor (ECF subfamily)